MFKVKNKDTRTMPTKLTIKIPERCHWRRSVVFIVNFVGVVLVSLNVNFKHISHLVLVFLLLTLSR